MAYRIGPEAISPGTISVVNREPGWNAEYETIERKGLGHPDTIADTLAAKISQAYSRYTTEYHGGLVLHHQIDKLMVIGGKTELSFGGGKFVEPIRIVVAGRASYSFGGVNVPVQDIVESTIREYFATQFKQVLPDNLIIENYLTNYAGPGTLRESSGAIANMFDPKDKNAVRGYETLVANDTSYCVSYEPLTVLEKSVLEVEKFLNNPDTKHSFPWLGTDIKIMAVRNGSEVAITSCIPQIAEYVNSLDEYLANLAIVGEVMDDMFNRAMPDNQISIALNTKDDYQKMNVYLTVSGASLSGDIGVVGRGNRTNGLITSNRPMSMEGTNGKNPRYYSGFIYANLTKRISREIYRQTHRANIVEMVSQNGGPLKEPWRTRVTSRAEVDLIVNIITHELANVEQVTRDFISGDIENY